MKAEYYVLQLLLPAWQIYSSKYHCKRNAKTRQWRAEERNEMAKNFQMVSCQTNTKARKMEEIISL